MHRILCLAALVVAGACGSSTPVPPTDRAPDVVTKPLVDPATAPLPARELVPAAPPAEVAAPVRAPEANGRFAVARSVKGQPTFADEFEIAAGDVRSLSSAELPAAHMESFGWWSHVVWADAGAPFVLIGRGEVFGTVVDGRFTEQKRKGKGDIIGYLISTAGEVWLELCHKWNEDNPEEEGCDVHRYYRVTPKAATATRRPKLRVRPTGTVPAPAAPLLKEDANGNFVLECTNGPESAALFADGELYEAPTWRWLSAEPPIALVRGAYRGSGWAPEWSTYKNHLLRGCILDDNDPQIAEGPDGLWALRIDGPDVGSGTGSTWQVMWRGVLLATVPGTALAFAGGFPASGSTL